MKILEYPKTGALKPTDVFLLDGPDGTRGITAEKLAKESLKLAGPEEIGSKLNISSLDNIDVVSQNDRFLLGHKDGSVSSIAPDQLFYGLLNKAANRPESPGIDKASIKNSIFRGKNLGSALTEDQCFQIRSGNFDGLFLGDYWNIGGYNWRIVDFDYWIAKGSSYLSTHHIVIMPDADLIRAPMNVNPGTTGGYAQSDMRVADNGGLNLVKPIIFGAFGEDHILNHTELLVSQVDDKGIPTGGQWYQTKVEIPSESMIFGYRATSGYSAINPIPYVYNIDNGQLSLMRSHHYWINTQNKDYWLRDSLSSVDFSLVSSSGINYFLYSSDNSGVRPVFGLVG